MREPEVALAFTADVWVEELHRHLTDHGGARVRMLVVEGRVALEESYDVLVAGHRWPSLTRALVADVHTRGRAILGVYDREEPASRKHLAALGVDAVLESDASNDAFVRGIVELAATREERPSSHPLVLETRVGRVITVGGAPGVGRTEIAIQLAIALSRQARVALIDADDVAPAIAQRLGFPIEPNLRTAIDAVEHGLGRLDESVRPERVTGLPVVCGVPSATGWSQMRPGEIMRVVDRLADLADIVVADGAGLLEDLSASSGRSRFATARTLVAESDAVVVVAGASPHGVARMLSWIVEARALAPTAPMVAVVNRAPDARFRRGEIYEEITSSVPVLDVVFVPPDARVGDGAWNGLPAARGSFTRAVDAIGRIVGALPRLVADATDVTESDLLMDAS